MRLRRADRTEVAERLLFQDVDGDLITRMVNDGYAKVGRLEVGQRLKLKTADVYYTYIIIDGYLVITAPSRFDKTKETFIAWREPEQIIGERSPEERPSREKPPEGAEPLSSVITASDDCKLLEIPYDKFKLLLQQSWRMYDNMVTLLLQKLASETRRSEVIRSYPYMEMKVALALLFLEEERPLSVSQATGNPIIPGIINKKDLGKYIGVTNRTVTAGLHTLKEAGLISYERKKPIEIKDKEQLKEIATNEKKAHECHRQFSKDYLRMTSQNYARKK